MKKTIVNLLSVATLLVCAPAQVWANNAFAPQEIYSINSAPSVVGISASNITATSAAVNLDFTASTGNANVVVRYGVSSLNLSSAPQTVASMSLYTNTVRFNLNSLLPNTVYNYVFDITDVNGVTVSSTTKSFRTTTSTPTVSNVLASNVTLGSAVINASVNSQNSIATFYIDYGINSLNLYNTVNLTTQIGNNTANFSKLLTGLQHNTTYYYRIRVEYSAQRNCDLITVTYPISSFYTDDPAYLRVGKSDNVSIYPNPVTDLLNVVAEDDINHVEVIDLKGKILLVAKTTQINVNHLPAGTYMVRVTDANGKVFTHKFNKQ